jgi:hypothetical protein
MTEHTTSDTSVRVSKLAHTFAKKRVQAGTHLLLAETYARVPVKVLSDPRVSDYDARVYASMCALERDNGKVTCGVRMIALVAGKSYSGVAKSIWRLCDYGHVEVNAGNRGQRTWYQLVWKMRAPE